MGVGLEDSLGEGLCGDQRGGDAGAIDRKALSCGVSEEGKTVGEEGEEALVLGDEATAAKASRSDPGVVFAKGAQDVEPGGMALMWVGTSKEEDFLFCGVDMELEDGVSAGDGGEDDGFIGRYVEVFEVSGGAVGIQEGADFLKAGAKLVALGL